MKDINDKKCVLANVKSKNRKSIQGRREYNLHKLKLDKGMKANMI